MKLITILNSGAFRQYVAALSATIVVFGGGCWDGWPSPSLPRIKSGETGFNVTSEQLSWVVAFLDAGNVVAPIPVSYLADIFGRKLIIVLTGLLLLSTWVLTAVANCAEWLYLARFLAGIGKGVCFSVVPVYLGEIASTNIRGGLSSMFNGLLSFGTLFQFIIGPFLSFRVLAIVNGVSLLLFCSFFFMPDSPYYLLMRGRVEDARKALKMLRNRVRPEESITIYVDPVENELKAMQEAVVEELKNKGGYRDLFSTPGSRRAMLIVLVIFSCINLCGALCLLQLSSITLPPNDVFIGPSVAIIIFGITLTVFNFIATPLIDRVGRRPLLILSGVGCGFCNGASAIFYFLNDKTDTDMTGFIWVPYLSLVLFGAFYTVGIASIPFTLISELFPTNLRGSASSLATTIFSGFSFAVSILYIPVTSAVGVYANFALFSVVGFFVAVFTYFIIFETKGKTFTEIQQILHGKKIEVNLPR